MAHAMTAGKFDSLVDGELIIHTDEAVDSKKVSVMLDIYADDLQTL